ncbi:MAG: hypothetical protein AB1482_11635 [Pseudomonadota bacterium]
MTTQKKTPPKLGSWAAEGDSKVAARDTQYSRFAVAATGFLLGLLASIIAAAVVTIAVVVVTWVLP